ncbi:MAG: sodium:calcium antiporter [Nitrospirae bacterium]|nr:sodium:calcium antiporter [Nitrospirota bacterium]
MLIQSALLLAGLVLILLAAEFFTNGIEALGRHFSFSQAVVGSLLAAVGTALPETILPVVAIFMYGGDSAKEIGVGAILGAPFMLSTLAFFLVGLTVAVSAIKGNRRFELNIEVHSVKRDVTFFLVMYLAAVVLPLAFGRTVAVPLAIALVGGYIFYAWMTFRGESAEIEHGGHLYLWKMLGRFIKFGTAQRPSPILILVQVTASLAVMVQGAHTFVKSLERISVSFGLEPLIFALLLAPVATELPEKFNSVTWTWKGRDTLALGNITGAMVFQATFPVSVGLLYTDWRLTGMALFSAVLAITSALVVLGAIVVKKRVSPLVMLFGGLLYMAYAIVLVLR